MKAQEGAPLEVTVSMHHYATYFLALVRDYQLTFRNDLMQSVFPVGEVAKNKKDAYHVIRALIEESVTRRLRWMSSPILADSVIASVIPGYGDPDTPNRTLSILEKIIDPMMNEIHDFIGGIVPDRSWRMWTLDQLGSDIVLSQGEDFRVYEWTRAVEERKLEYPHVVMNEVALDHQTINDLDFQKRSTRYQPKPAGYFKSNPLRIPELKPRQSLQTLQQIAHEELRERQELERCQERRVLPPPHTTMLPILKFVANLGNQNG